MTTALATVQPSSIAQADGSLTREQVELVKRTICRGATDDELALFVQTANRLRLDPFARQMFAVKRWDSDARREVMSIQVSIDGFRLVAERTGRYAPGRPTEYDERDGRLLSATAYVKKLAGGVWHEVAETAHWSEYCQTTKEGKPTRMWQRMPHVMLAKCAESRALRRAFPAELAGVYTADEMAQETREPAPADLPEFKADVPDVIDVAHEAAATVKATFPGAVQVVPPEDEEALIKARELDEATRDEDIEAVRAELHEAHPEETPEGKEARRVMLINVGKVNGNKAPMRAFAMMSHARRQESIKWIREHNARAKEAASDALPF
jgi:phage recombination protein Bet